jgi:hypothetical protein
MKESQEVCQDWQNRGACVASRTISRKFAHFFYVRGAGNFNFRALRSKRIVIFHLNLGRVSTIETAWPITAVPIGGAMSGAALPVRRPPLVDFLEFA